MLKINNKGQSLVMFVLIIPIFLLILTLVYDVGNAIYEKDRLSNTNYLTIEYGLNNIDTVTENDLKNLIQQNTSNLKYIYVTIEENQIDDFYKLIGSNVKKMRNKKGLSQLQLSQALGHKSVGLVSQSELYLKKQHFNIKHLYQIAFILDCEVDDFLKKQDD